MKKRINIPEGIGQVTLIGLLIKNSGLSYEQLAEAARNLFKANSNISKNIRIGFCLEDGKYSYVATEGLDAVSKGRCKFEIYEYEIPEGIEEEHVVPEILYFWDQENDIFPENLIEAKAALSEANNGSIIFIPSTT